jgi:hypothetical protein
MHPRPPIEIEFGRWPAEHQTGLLRDAPDDMEYTGAAGD